MFPLGRFYKNHSFQYFLQVHECPKTDRSKVKIKKWLDTPNLKTYEKYIADWHFFLKGLQEYVMNLTSDSSSNSKSESSKSDSKKDTSSSSKAESSKPESSKSEPKPTQHTHSWKDITKATRVKVVDQKAYTYEEPIYEKQIRTICKVCGADITGFASEHNEQHALNGEPVSYKAERREIQTGTKTVTVPEKSHYETTTKVVGRKCSGCGKVEYY